MKNVVDGVVQITRPRNRQCNMYKGLHSPIVSEEQWDLVNEITRKRSNSAVHRSSVLLNPFSGLVYCSKCGRQMVRKPDPKVPDSLRCNTRGCDTVSTYIEVFEKRVLEALKIWISDYKIAPEEILSNKKEKSIYVANIEVLRKEIEELTKQQENTYTFLERGIYTEELFLQRNSAVTKELNAAKSQLEALEKKLDALDSSMNGKLSIIPKMQNIIDCYYTIDSAAGKNAMLKEVIDHIEYEKGPENRGKIDNFSIKIYPKLK